MTTKKSYNIIFAGTPAFAATALEALLHSPHQIKAVYTQPDRPAGRGQKLTASPVKQLALQHQLPIHQPVSLRDEKEQAILKELNADLMIVVAYGLILPKAVLQAPHLGCINIHASLLPRWRGAAPIQRAIFAGDEKTGITIMQMDEGLDTGPMLDKVECRIESQDTSESLHDRLALLGAKEIIQVLEKLNSFSPISQDATKATYAQKITKDEAKINWDLSADEISRQVRAFNPWPVAVTSLDDQVIRIWKTEVVTHEKTSAQPGAIMQINSYGAEIATGKGVLRLLKIQLPGGKALPVADVLNAKREILTPGKVLKS